MTDLHAKAVRTRGGEITIRPLRAGDTETVARVFNGLSARSRRLRFGGAKNVLTPCELDELARVDGAHHVLVAHGPDGEAVGIARLARAEDDRETAEIAFAVADAWQRNGIGTALLEELAAAARAAGIRHLRASILAENVASLALMRHVTHVESTRYVGGQLEVVGAAA